jgi:hypothetical protein
VYDFDCLCVRQCILLCRRSAYQWVRLQIDKMRTIDIDASSYRWQQLTQSELRCLFSHAMEIDEEKKTKATEILCTHE